MAGDATAVGLVNDNLKEQNKLLDEYRTKKTAPTEDEIHSYVALSESYRDGAASFRTLTDAQASGQRVAKEVSDALLGIVSDSGTATKEVDRLGNTLYTLPDNTEILVNAKTGQASQNVSAFKGDLDGIPETVNTRVNVTVDTAAAQRQIDAFTKSPYFVKLGAQDSYGRRIL